MIPRTAVAVVLLVSAAIHGDEISGIEVIRRRDAYERDPVAFAEAWQDAAAAVICDLPRASFEAQGPMMLEVNARPGLSIQLANGIGLLRRLEPILARRDVRPEGEPAEQRIAYCRERFATAS